MAGTRPSPLYVELATCGTVLCEPGWSWHATAKRMSDFDLWFVWAGRGELRTHHHTYPVHAGSTFCLRPGHAIDATHDPAHRLGVCYFHFSFVNPAGLIRRPPAGSLPPLHAVLDDVAFYESLLRRAAEWSHIPTRRAQAVRLLESVLLAMHTAPERPAVPPRHADRILPLAREIRQNPGHPWAVPALAALADLSVDHFTRLFATHTGTTPKTFIIRARIDRAQSLLRESPASVEQVAEMLGYPDAFTFSKQFKRVAGVTPSRWRSGQLSVPGA